MRPRKISDEQRERIRVIAFERARIPSNKVLARELGVAEKTIANLITQFREFTPIPRGTIPLHPPGHDVCSGSSLTNQAAR